ncbi:MAG: HAMP domain-containing histidine kinase [Ferrovum sp.]|nr:HAMP domain-containing histidine kinase [Ferrovum sp.]NDU87827.1 HAMP domain-containing histidine kinase [Ferrovum sp.]
MTWARFKRFLLRAPFPFSFKHLLWIAFAGIVVLLGGALLRALVAVDTLSRDSRDFPAKALQRTEEVRELQDITVTLERQTRQYLVLHDRSLRQDITHSLEQGEHLVGVLSRGDAEDLTPLLTQWTALTEETISPLLEPGGDFFSPSATDNVIAAFGQLGLVDQQIQKVVQNRLADQNQKLLQAFDKQRQDLITMGITAATVAIALALLLGTWLSWSFAQLDRAIRQLGQPQSSASKPFGGPTDLRQLGERVRWVQQRLALLESDKLQFFRHISHELKTPLANLREGVALLSEEVPGPINGAQEEILVILRDNSLALQHQIESLLQYNAAASGAQHLHRQWIDIRGLLDQLVERQRLQIQAKALRVAVHGPVCRVWMDADKLDTVASNLLINAIRFSPEAGTVLINLIPAGKGFHLDVVDEGPGVDPQDGPQIFNPFYQGKRQPSGARKGSGVGLSIVRELVQAHGGTVRLEPSPRGAHFHLEIPGAEDEGVAVG